jgi:hypothetical protein
MRERQIPCLLECSYRQLSGNAGEMFNKIVERISTLKIVKQGLKGYPSAGKAGCAPHNLSVAGDSRFHSELRYREDHYQANRGGLVANDEAERRGNALPTNEAALFQSSTPLLVSSKLRPAIAPADC